MPHQCVRCNKFYDDGSKEILQGCTCGGKLFFYVRKEQIEKAKNDIVKLTEDDRKQIEEDVFELVGSRPDHPEDQAVVLDLETIRIKKPGQYELDLVNIFRKQPLVYRVEDGKYIIDLPQSFLRNKDKE